MRSALLTLPLLLSGCNAISNWADDVGTYFPVVNERCEHWQCLTEEGQKKDEAKKRALAKKEKAAAPKPTAK